MTESTQQVVSCGNSLVSIRYNLIYIERCSPMVMMLRIIITTMQTYIEPAFDVWTREKKKWNLFTTDPKGGAPRSIVKSYSLAA